MSCPSSIFLTASLDILYYKLFNLKNKVRKIEHEEIFCGPSKLLKNISWPINIRLKYFMTPKKTLRSPSPPTYLMYGPSVPSVILHGNCNFSLKDFIGITIKETWVFGMVLAESLSCFVQWNFLSRPKESVICFLYCPRAKLTTKRLIIS